MLIFPAASGYNTSKQNQASLKNSGLETLVEYESNTKQKILAGQLPGTTPILKQKFSMLALQAEPGCCFILMAQVTSFLEK